MNIVIIAKLKSIKWFNSEAFLACLFIIIIGILSYGLFYSPAIYADDWSQGIERTINGAVWFNISNRRPLLFTPFLIQYHLFGLDVSAYYFVLWFFNLISAILLYITIINIPIIRKNHFGLLITLLFLIYPSVYTHMWLTTIHIYYAACLSLLFCFFLMKFTKDGRLLTLCAAILCLSLSFGFYEAQLGIAYAWMLILILAYPNIKMKNRITSFFVVTAISAGFVIWRIFGLRLIGGNDPYFSQINFVPSALLLDILNGYKINLVWGWTTTIEYWMPWLHSAKIAVIFIGGLVLIIWYLSRKYLYLGSVNAINAPVSATGLREQWVNLRPYVIIGLLGLGLIGAGYIPILALYLPNLSGLGSRVNLFASIGGAIFLCSVLMVGSILFAKKQRQVPYLFIFSVIPFMVIGIVTQASVQYENRVAWHEQQNIWRQLFSIAPNFEDNTEVLFILPGYQDSNSYQSWKRTPLSSSWEVSSAVRLFYNNPTLSGDVIFPDIVGDNEPALTPQGIVAQGSTVVVPYSQLVTFLYDSKTGTLHQLDSLPADLIPGAENPAMLGIGRVLKEKVPKSFFRSLVK